MLNPESLTRRGILLAPSLSPSFFSTSDPTRRPTAAPPPPPPDATCGDVVASASAFPHNRLISLALLPATAFLLDLGGAPTLILLTVGLTAAYILDLLAFRRLSLLLLSAYLAATQITFFYSAAVPRHPFPLSVLSLALCAHTALLITVWAILNNKWLQTTHRPIAATLQRLLFACVPVTVPSLFTFAVVSAVGIANAAYYHLAFVCLYYHLFTTIDSKPFVGCIHSLHLVLSPVMFFVGAHHRHIPICDGLLLLFTPALFLMCDLRRGGMGWVMRDEERMKRIRVVVGGVALIVVVVCLEIRVVFHSFGKYLHASPQVSVVLVTVSMVGGVLGFGAYAVGMVKDSASETAFMVMTMLASATGAIVLGFPVSLIPFPLACGFYLARFCTKKSLLSYFVFVVSASSMFLWFIVQNFWGLNIWVVGTPLKFFCRMIFFTAVVAMVVPGLVLLPRKLHFLTGLGLLGHTLLLCYLENQFFTYSSLYYYGLDDEAMYPSYMVLTTTCLGLALVRRLDVDRRIGSKAIWMMTCLYSSKIAMLCVASKSIIWVSAGLLLAVSPPVLLYKDKGAQKMKPWQGYAHACVAAFSAWVCREMIFEAIQLWNGRPPSDGLLVGFCVLLTGVACIPIVALHFPLVQSAKKSLVLLVAMGLLIVFMQPPILLSGALRSDLIKAAHQSSNDISVYGFVASKPSWPSWLLIMTIMLTLAAATSTVPVKYMAELRVFYVVWVGITFGIYICAEYFFQAIMLYPFLVVIITCAAGIIVFSHLPSASSTRILPWVFALMVALLPITYLLEGQLSATTEEGGEADRFADMLVISRTRMSLLGLYAMLFMLIALVIKFKLHSLMCEKALKRGPEPVPSSSITGFALKFRFMQQRRASNAPLFTIKRLTAEAAWMPAVGNVSTLLCFIICLVLSMYLTGGSNRAIFLLAPILLLLNLDSDIRAAFSDRQRYFPVTSVVSGYLIVTASYRIWEQVWHGDVGWGLNIGGPGWFFAVKNAALLILTLPNHILFNRFMWDYVKPTGTVVLIAMPLTVPSIFMTDIVTVRVFGLLGVAYSLSQYMVSRREKIASKMYI